MSSNYRTVATHACFCLQELKLSFAPYNYGVVLMVIVIRSS